MNNYSFGNFITALREGIGLSQFQLGKLVGVSDKAVSKWENGNSKPRLNVCEKLADIFHLSIDDLLCCRDGNFGNNDYENKIWDKCRKRFRDFYGENAPISFQTRLEAEITAFSGKRIAETCDLLGTIYGAVSRHELKAYIVSYVKASLTAWLLGATSINPLKPHMICPNCKRIEMHPEVLDAWDLETHLCSCGHKMRREGHDIPFSMVMTYVDHYGINADFRVSEAESEKLYSIISSYYAGRYYLSQYRLEDVTYSNARVKRYMLMEGESPSGSVSGRNIPVYTYKEMKANSENHIHLTFIIPDKVPGYRSAPPADDIISPGTIQKAYKIMLDEPEMVLDSDPNMGPLISQSASEFASLADDSNINMSTLIQIIGLYYISPPENNFGMKLIKAGKCSLKDLPVTVDAVWSEIIQKMRTADWFEVGFADKVASDIKTYKYMKKGMSPEIKDALLDLGFPNDIADHIGHSGGMWTKENLLTVLLFKYLYPAYFSENRPNIGPNTVRYW